VASPPSHVASPPSHVASPPSPPQITEGHKRVYGFMKVVINYKFIDT